MADILISASAADKALAEHLGQMFFDRGFTVDWMTLDPSEPGNRAAILSRRAAARATLALWSKSSVRDPSVVEEAREALRRGSLLAARLDDAHPAPEFNAAPIANLVAWDGSVGNIEAGRLLTEVARILDRSATRPALAMTAARLVRSAGGGAVYSQPVPDMRPSASFESSATAAAPSQQMSQREAAVAPVPVNTNTPNATGASATAPAAIPEAKPAEAQVLAANFTAAKLDPVKPSDGASARDGAALRLTPAPVQMAGSAAGGGLKLNAITPEFLAENGATVLREVKRVPSQDEYNAAATPTPVAAASEVSRAETPAPALAPAPRIADQKPSTPASEPVRAPNISTRDEMFTPRKAAAPARSAPPQRQLKTKYPAAKPKPFLRQSPPRTRQDDINHGLAWLAGLAACAMLLAFWHQSRPEDFALRASGPAPIARQTAANTFQEPPVVTLQGAEGSETAAASDAPAMDNGADAGLSHGLAPVGAPQSPAPVQVQAAPPIVQPNPAPVIAAPALGTAAAIPTMSAPAPVKLAALKPVAPQIKVASAAPVTTAPVVAAPAPPAIKKAATASAKPALPPRLGLTPKTMAAPKTLDSKFAFKTTARAPHFDAPAAVQAPAMQAPISPAPVMQNSGGISPERLANVGASLDKVGAAPKTIQALAKTEAPKQPVAPTISAPPFEGFDPAPSLTVLQFGADAAFHLPGLAPTLLSAWQPGASAPAPALPAALTEADWNTAPARTLAQSALIDGAYDYHLTGARLGDPKSMLTLGLMRQTGIGAEANENIAYAWLRRAAIKGDPRALAELGAYYASGRAAPRDDARGTRLFAKSASSGAAAGQTALGWAFASGRGVVADPAKARALFEDAAKQGDALAALNLGRLYADGLGGARDPQAAIRWYGKAADQGFAPAQYALAVMLLQDVKAQPSDAPTSAEASGADLPALRLQQAAAQGYPDAQMLLGALYANGIGVQKDDALSKAWYERASKPSASLAKPITLAVLRPQNTAR